MSERVLIVTGTSIGIGGMDSGAQGYLTADAMRRYLGWDAKCLCFQQSYLGYDYDWVRGFNISDESVLKYAADCSMVIFMDSPEVFRDFKLAQAIQGIPTCVLGVGTGLRLRSNYTLMDQITGRLPVIVPPHDETLVNAVCGVPFDFVIVDIDEIDRLTQPQHDEFTICHAHTRALNKGHDQLVEIIKRIPYNKEQIFQQPWAQSIATKSRSHVVLDDFYHPSYGLNVLEAAVMRQHVVSSIGPWCYFIDPELPFGSCHPSITGKSVVDGAIDMIEDMVEEKGPDLEVARKWVEDKHHAKNVAPKWRWFAKWLHTQ